MADEKLYSGHTAEEVIELMGMLAASFDVHSHDEWMRIVRKGYALLKEQTSKLDALQTKHNELHRRCQLAEGAVLRKMEAEQAAGAPIAKRLAMAGFAAEQERRIELESRLGEALKLVDEVRAFYDMQHRDVEPGFTWDGWLKRAALVVETRECECHRATGTGATPWCPVHGETAVEIPVQNCGHQHDMGFTCILPAAHEGMHRGDIVWS